MTRGAEIVIIGWGIVGLSLAYRMAVRRCGDHGDRRGFDERLDWSLLPRLIDAVTHRLPASETARITRGWAGLREMTPDELAIVGTVPGVGGSSSLSASPATASCARPRSAS